MQPYLTKQQKYLNRKNRKKAREFFGIEDKPEYILHHKDPSWQYNDIDRYIAWNPEDLIVMTQHEHALIHRLGHTHTEEGIRKAADARKGRPLSEEHKRHISESQTGRKVTEEQREHYRQSALDKPRGIAVLDMRWYNNGNEEIYIESHLTPPEGFVSGRLPLSDDAKAKISADVRSRKWYNNGEKSVRLREGEVIPEGFVPGRLYRRR